MKKIKNLSLKEFNKFMKRVDKISYKEWQEAIFKRDEGKCVFCNKSVHPKHYQTCHIIPYEFEDTRYDIMNGLLACFYHHKVGKYSMHKHPLWLVLWLQKHRPEQYAYIFAKMGEVTPKGKCEALGGIE